MADGTIYLYFKNKDDILVQFFGFKTRQVFDRFRDAVDRAGTAVEKLRRLICIHLEAFQKDRSMAIVYQAETHQISRPAEDEIRKMSKMYMDIVSEIIEMGQQEGSIRKDLYLGLVRRVVIGSVDEVINTWLHADREYDLLSMADPLVDLFIRGVGNFETEG